MIQPLTPNSTPNSPIRQSISRCFTCKKIFKSKRGIDASTKLTQIFGDENWGTKFYCNNETTLVVTNLDDTDSEEESPYKRGEIVFEWRSKQEKDAEDLKKG
ncbi:hypothetical protein C1645_831217 [Glomus cerebriforme]|uniref:Uncharacterized protein n=1 Tax=Glomus cerebriforme TaxID=658196 RepID=A0A397SFX3_9GLOM|nr:hypothetical protein C1645_831217 [Glomus cerebriforme]